jgi:DNA segregation ATPase FtsK/SpoIIIE, S-DNA-T family
MPDIINYTSEQTNNLLALTKKFNGLDLDVKPSSIEEGPVVTAYIFTIGNGQPLSQVIKKSEDLALSVGADKVVVQRIKDKIAVFIPNAERKIVEYKDILYWYLNDENVLKAELPIPLGVDFHGEKSYLDIVNCPHVLICGSTGSGKSVFESSIVASLVYFYDSSILNLYLVDTKQVDLTLFKSLPHVKVCVDNLDDFHTMMYGIMQEIRRRLSVMQTTSVRNIQAYHKLMGGRESMPYIVIVIDEFADLSDSDSSYRKVDKDKYEGTPTVKQWLKQCTQIARAAGVHIIACTQRASVKVIDGDTKTNLPCRIALRLSTQVDSRTILDTGGAENLLGRGDMLIKQSDKDTLDRYHGPFVSMEDINQLVINYQFIKETLRPRR